MSGLKLKKRTPFLKASLKLMLHDDAELCYSEVWQQLKSQEILARLDERQLLQEFLHIVVWPRLELSPGFAAFRAEGGIFEVNIHPPQEIGGIKVLLHFKNEKAAARFRELAGGYGTKVTKLDENGMPSVKPVTSSGSSAVQ